MGEEGWERQMRGWHRCIGGPLVKETCGKAASPAGSDDEMGSNKDIVQPLKIGG